MRQSKLVKVDLKIALLLALIDFSQSALTLGVSLRYLMTLAVLADLVSFYLPPSVDSFYVEASALLPRYFLLLIESFIGQSVL